MCAGIMHYYMLMHTVLSTTQLWHWKQSLYTTAKQTLVEQIPKNATNDLKQPWTPKSLISFQKVQSCRRKPLEPVYFLSLCWYPSLHHLSRACNPCIRVILCIYATSYPTETGLITARKLNIYISLKPTFVQTSCFLSGCPLKRKEKHALLLYVFSTDFNNIYSTFQTSANNFVISVRPL